MIKQGILSLVLFFTILLTLNSGYAKKLDNAHRCYQKLCVGQTLFDDEDDPYKVIMIIPKKSILLHSSHKQEFKALSWKDLPESTYLPD